MHRILRFHSPNAHTHAQNYQIRAEQNQRPPWEVVVCGFGKEKRKIDEWMSSYGRQKTHHGPMKQRKHKQWTQ